ncbi:MAG: hypothetical protein N3A69_02005 [Leptospiraceae bacterium]|nr:hypothetical protein [Leptospiraceae bacterium]
MPFSNSGLSGLGLTLDDKTSPLFQNPFLLSTNSIKLDLGVTQSFHQTRNFPVLFAPASFFYKLDAGQGIGVNFYSPFRSLRNSETRLLYYSGNLFYTFTWKEILISIGLGPRVAWRGTELSKWSFGGFLNLEYTGKDWSIGIFYERSGNFFYKMYRGSDELKERLPDFVFFGISKKINSLRLQIELGRVLYEFSRFVLNDRNEKPSLERGIGAEIRPSLGFEHTLSDKVKFRLGIGFIGEYDEDGKNRRSTRLSFGNLIFPLSEENFYIKWSYVNHSILSKKGGYTPENSFSLSSGYLW